MLLTLLQSGGVPPVPPAPVVPEEQASNWQANYWVHSKRRTKDDEDEERRRLGILPPEQQAQADMAVREVVQASVDVQRGESTGEALRLAMEARAAFEDAYRKALKDAYTEEFVAAQWELQISRERRRRAAVLLLLH